MNPVNDERNARAIAFYLPQFHPIPENDEWWGPGFTDWISVARGKPLFPGHRQPILPGELGFYDLRLPETRMAQAELAQQHGIEGFCYWHYWFGGGRLLERPFNEVLQSGEPNFPFCLGWANESWNSVWWFGVHNKPLVEQGYPGIEDHKNHFYYLLRAFSDDRYIRVRGKPLFFVYHPHKIPDLLKVTDCWRELAHQAGLPGLHLVCLGLSPQRAAEYGFDAVVYDRRYDLRKLLISHKFFGDHIFRFRVRKMLHRPVIFSYKQVIRHLIYQGPSAKNEYPSIYPNWDNTARSLFAGWVWQGSTPELFRIHTREAIQSVIHKDLEDRIIFVKSWNEWGEGNYLEPDRYYGRAYLEVLRDEIIP